MEPGEQQSEPGQAARARRPLWARLLVGLVWLVVSLASLVLSVAYHFTLPETRALVRHLIEGPASEALMGDIEVGRIDELTLGRARFTDVVIRDPQGRVVIYAPRVTAWPDLGRLLQDGTIRIAGGLVEDAEVVLYVEGEDGLEVSLVQAFQPTVRGEPGGEPVHVMIDGLRVDGALVHGDAPRYPGLRVEDTDVYGRIEIAEEVEFTVVEGRGTMTGPYPGETAIERIELTFTTDRAVGLDAYAEASRGPSRARARARIHWPDGEGTPPEIRITAAAEPMCMGTLADMGFPGLDRMLGCAEGLAVLEGPPEALALTASLTTEAGTVDVVGMIPSDRRYRFEGRTTGLRLERLVDEAPELTFSGRASITLNPDEDADERAIFDLDAEPLSVSGYDLPAFSARGRIRRDRLVVDGVTAPYLQGGVEGTGEVGFDGSMSVHVDVDVADAGDDPNIARLVPGAHGGAVGGLDIVTTAGAEDLDIRWNLVFSPFRYGPVRAARLRTTGRARGPRGGLAIQADASSDGTTVRGLRFGHAEGTLRGGPGPYQVELRSRGGSDVREVRTNFRIVRAGGGLDLLFDDYATDLGFGLMTDRAHPESGPPASVAEAQVRIRGRRFELGAIEVTRGDSRLSVRGVVDTAGAGTDLHLEAAGFDITLLRPHLPERFSALAGVAHASLDLDGDLSDPDVVLDGAVADATLDGRRHFALTFRSSYSDGALYAHVDGDLGDTGRMRVDGPIAIAWADLIDPDRVLDAAVFSGLEVDLDRVNVAFLTPFAGESIRALGAVGKVTVAVRLEGGLNALDVPWGVVILDNFGLPNTSTVRVKLEGAMASSVLTLDRVWIADNRGELLTGGAMMHLPLADPPDTGPAWLSAIAARPWRLRLDVNHRRVDGWPRPISKHLPRGLTFGGVLELMGDGTSVTSHLDAEARFDEAATSAACAADLRPAIQVTGDTDALGVTTGHLSLLLDEAVVATGTTTSSTPMHDWLLRGVQPTTPPTLTELHVIGLDLERLPWTCDIASGEVTGEATGTLFDPSPDLSMRLTVAGLRVRSGEDAPPSRAYRGHVRVQSEGNGLNAVEACVILGREDGARTPIENCPHVSALRSETRGSIAEDGELIAAFSIPVRVGEGASLPEVAWTEDMFALLDAQAAELEPLLIAIPGVAQANAFADGTVRAEGVWDTLALEGGMLIREGEARVISMGQYLHDVGGPLRFSGNRIVIPEDRPWSGWDGDRRVTITGEVGLLGLLPVTVDATARPSGFPFRREGGVLAELSGDLHLHADISTTGVEGEVRTGALTIQLPPSAVGAVQDLPLLPEVLVIGEDAPDLGRDRHLRFPYHLVIDASRPFIVRRNDFEVSVSAMLDATYDAPDLFLRGVADIQRGTFEVLGKRFEVTRGSLTFDGSNELDPIVDLVATYELPGRSGASVSIIASGTLTDVSIDFQSTESSDTGEIVALLVSGRPSRASDPAAAQQAGREAANFLGGLAGGLVSLILRDQLGGTGFVPNVSLEDGGRGTVAARVGFDADWIIPDFLREIVLGAYLEGVGGVAGGGGTVELQFPLSFYLSGSYLFPSNGSVDLLWDAF